MYGTLFLECKRDGEPWHTLNTATFASDEGREMARRRLRDFGARWAAQGIFIGHQFRVTDRTSERASATAREILGVAA